MSGTGYGASPEFQRKSLIVELASEFGSVLVVL
jgi:hypothetical protein